MSTTPQPAATYVRHTVDRLTEQTAKPGDDTTIWDLVHLLGIIAGLDAAGYGDAVRRAADDSAACYGLPPQSHIH